MLQANNKREFGDFKRDRCFEILGFDVIIDDKYKPWLLEINFMPAFHCASPVDKIIKSGVIIESFHLTNIDLETKE